jgi:hypothetical protein
VLEGRRRRLRQLEEAEAKGENFWHPQFDPEARQRLVAELETKLGDHPLASVWRSVTAQVWVELGRDFRASTITQVFVASHDDLMPSLLEAVALRVPSFEAFLNTVLTEHRISWEMVDGEMITFQSKELHQQVIIPTLRLLSGREGWEDVEAAYQDALREVAAGHAADAITDAATALDQALRLLGCDGNSLGPLAKSAKAMGLLARHDSTLADAIEKIIHWVSADRSESGDAHPGGDPSREDAWFTVHIVGTLILRLAGTPRT